MARLKPMGLDETDRPNYSLFKAAENDDLVEMAGALRLGQSLDEVDFETGNTPVHLACLNRSEQFLRAIKHLQFNPWIRGNGNRLPSDLAFFMSLPEAEQMFFDKMYPPHWGKGSISPLPQP